MARVSWRVTLDTAQAAVDVRRAFIRFLRSQSPTPARFFEAELVFGEIVSNIARHEPGHATIVVDVVRDEAIVTIEGPAAADPEQAVALPEGLSESGRGLYLIRTLARDYYVDRGPRGQKTTVVLGLPQLLAV